MNNKIICRKCGGEHLTIKCGKDVPVPIIDKEIVTPTESKPYKPEINRNDFDRKDFDRKDFDRKDFDRKDYRQKPRNYDKSKLPKCPQCSKFTNITPLDKVMINSNI